MLKSESILCSVPSRLAAALAAALLLGACGQRGPLYLPTEPAALGRATLPQTLNPARSAPATRAPTAAPNPAGEDVPASTGTGTASPVSP